MFVQAKAAAKKLKVTVYGESGVGKTHFALTFPDPAVIDTESGTDFFAGRFNFLVWKTKSYADVLAAVKMIERGEVKCQTLVIDSITVINDVLREAGFRAAEARARRKGREVDDLNLTPRDWGNIKMRIRSLLTRLYNLPVHTVIVGWLKDEYQDRPDGSSVRVGQTIDADKKILYQPDVILRLEVDRQGRRWGVVEKDRSGIFPVGKRIEDPSFAKLKVILERAGGGAAVEPAGPAAAGITEDEAAARDAALFGGPDEDAAQGAVFGVEGGQVPAGESGAGQGPPRCEACGAEVRQAVAAYSRHHFGRVLCKDCATRAGRQVAGVAAAAGQADKTAPGATSGAARGAAGNAGGGAARGRSMPAAGRAGSARARTA